MKILNSQLEKVKSQHGDRVSSTILHYISDRALEILVSEICSWSDDYPHLSKDLADKLPRHLGSRMISWARELMDGIDLRFHGDLKQLLDLVSYPGVQRILILELMLDQAS